MADSIDSESALKRVIALLDENEKLKKDASKSISSFDSLAKLGLEMAAKADSFEKANRNLAAFKASVTIDRIYPNKSKGTIVIIFKDGGKTILHLREGDVWCVSTAAAIAIAKRIAGSYDGFTAMVDMKTEDDPGKIGPAV